MPRAFLRNGVWLKKCANKECGAIKLISEFSRCLAKSDGRNSYCYRCSAAVCREYRRKKLDVYRARELEYRQRNRAKLSKQSRENYHKRKARGELRTWKYNPASGKRTRSWRRLTINSLAERLAGKFCNKKFRFTKLRLWLLGNVEFHRAFHKWAFTKSGRIKPYNNRSPNLKPSLLPEGDGFRITTYKEVKRQKYLKLSILANGRIKGAKANERN